MPDALIRCRVSRRQVFRKKPVQCAEKLLALGRTKHEVIGILQFKVFVALPCLLQGLRHGVRLTRWHNPVLGAMNQQNRSLDLTREIYW